MLTRTLPENGKTILGVELIKADCFRKPTANYLHEVGHFLNHNEKIAENRIAAHLVSVSSVSGWLIDASVDPIAPMTSGSRA